MTQEFKNTIEFHIAYSIMINAAQHQGFCTYQEIARAINLPLSGNYMQDQISELIGCVSQNEVDLGRPMLSSIVVGVSGKPGKGYFNFAKELNHLQETEDPITFWQSECQKVYDTWKIKYRLHK